MLPAQGGDRDRRAGQPGATQPGAGQPRAGQPGAAQAQRLPNGLRLLHLPVPEAAEVCIALAVPVGWRHDPVARTGLAEVVRWTLDAAQRHLPAAQRVQVETGSRATLLWHSGPRRDAVDRLAFLEQVLSGRVDVEGDTLALALGRARLESDDHSWLYPGSVIEQKAWRGLWRGAPEGRRSRGIPVEIAALDAPVVGDWLRRHYGCTGAALVVIGSPDADWWKDFVARLGQLPRSAGPPPETVHDSAPALEAECVHERVDGPYVTAAWRALEPTHADFPAFAVAVMALRAEVHRVFGAFHGAEWKARFPFVACDYWAGDPLVRVNRRGPNGSTVAATRSEIEAVLSRLRRTGLRRGALDSARLEVASTLAAPPYATAAAPYLAVRARYLATATCLDWPMDAGDRVGRVTLEAVDSALRLHLSAERARWFALRPAPGANRTR